MYATDGRPGEVESSRPFGAQRIVSGTYKARTEFVYMVEVWVFFDLTVTVP